MNDKVLFIIPDNHQTDNHFNFGFGYLAAVLREFGVDVSIYCMDIYHYSNEDLAKYLDNNSYSMIGTNFLCARYKETAEPLLSTIGKHKKNARLIIGGHCASAVPDYMLEQNPSVDVVAIGEAEETIIDLINNESLADIKGIGYRENGGIIINERRKPIHDLDRIPFPAYDLFPMDAYTSCLKMFNMEKGDKVFGILMSRGCVGRCSFCHRLEKGIRLRSIKNVIDEMKLLNEKHGVNYFLINDELFMVSKKRLFEFRDALQENGLKNIKFSADARVDMFDEEIAKTLKECGCQFVSIGFESMDPKVLNLMNKKTTVEQNIQAAEAAKKAKLPVGLNIIWGCPGDTEESLKKGVRFIKRYNDYSQIVRTIRPVTGYPGTQLFEQAIKDGLLLGPDDFFKAFQNSDLITINFTELDTKEMYKLLYLANHELIMDHYRHTNMSLEEADMLIDAFHDLYFLGKTDFRGARHYSAKDK